MATFDVGTRTHKAFLIDSSLTQQGNDIRLKGNQTTDFPDTGGKRVPEGAVVVKKTGDGLYYLATDSANVDVNAAASVSSSEKPDNDWKSSTITWEVSYAGQVFGGSVKAATTDAAIADFVTLLNNDAEFRNHCVASDAGATDLLVITTLAKGRVGLKVSSDLSSAFGADGQEDQGSEADVRVVYQQRDLVDLDGASRDSDATPSLLRGKFRRSALSFLTPAAESVLIGRGSTIE